MNREDLWILIAINAKVFSGFTSYIFRLVLLEEQCCTISVFVAGQLNNVNMQ